DRRQARDRFIVALFGEELLGRVERRDLIRRRGVRRVRVGRERLHALRSFERGLRGRVVVMPERQARGGDFLVVVLRRWFAVDERRRSRLLLLQIGHQLQRRVMLRIAGLDVLQQLDRVVVLASRRERLRAPEERLRVGGRRLFAGLVEELLIREPSAGAEDEHRQRDRDRAHRKLARRRDRLRLLRFLRRRRSDRTLGRRRRTKRRRKALGHLVLEGTEIDLLVGIGSEGSRSGGRGRLARR